jgi:hypothetical protein
VRWQEHRERAVCAVLAGETAAKTGWLVQVGEVHCSFGWLSRTFAAEPSALRIQAAVLKPVPAKQTVLKIDIIR